VATIAQIVNELSSSPAVQKLPVAELGQQLERLSGLDIAVAAKNRAMAEMGLDSVSPAALAREAIIGSPASIKAAALAGTWLSGSPAASSITTWIAHVEQLQGPLVTCLAEMNKGYFASLAADMARYESAAALASMRATIPDGLLSSLKAPEGLLASFEQPAWMAASLTAGLDRAYLLPEHDMPAAWGLIEQFERDDRAWQMAKQALEGSDQWRKLLEPALTARALWPEPEQLAGIYRQVEQYNLNLMADALSASQAPAALTRRPEPQPPPKRLPPPQSGNFGIQPAQPGQPAAWQEILADALQSRRATPEEIVQWLLQQDRGSQPLPLWADIEVIALDYQQNGSRYKNMDAFANKYRLHRATVDRYLRMYEAATGEQIRPGQGRAKRLSRR